MEEEILNVLDNTSVNRISADTALVQIMTIIEKHQALRIHGVGWRSEQLEPYEPDNFPKCGLCKSIHDPEMCCQY